ncbi:hypothetical protein B296_00047360 [Ensete ventricosum]|uniref:Uncharacterized protein n=1 Tax=Ensete ventricosum TaxID=4639 RepID=A0A426X8X6_ENSVE|nr:hypothetical protein B296_00047360 [Ensete ventricosum]
MTSHGRRWARGRHTANVVGVTSLCHKRKRGGPFEARVSPYSDADVSLFARPPLQQGQSNSRDEINSRDVGLGVGMLASLVRSLRAHGLWAQGIASHKVSHKISMFVMILVFGMDKKYWFIPAYSEEDLRRMPALQGLKYPTKPNLDVLGDDNDYNNNDQATHEGAEKERSGLPGLYVSVNPTGSNQNNVSETVIGEVF